MNIKTLACGIALVVGFAGSMPAQSVFEQITGAPPPPALQVNVPTVQQVINAVADTPKAVAQVPVAALQGVAKVIDQAAKDIKTGGDDLIRNGQREAGIFGQNVADQLQRDNKNATDALQAIGEAPGNAWQLSGDALAQFDTRVREGKLLDAAWHLTIAPQQIESVVAARMAHQSSVLRTFGEIAADAYGGPAGAATFAGWYAYNETDDWLTATKSAVIVGGADAALIGLDEIPVSDSTGEMAVEAGKLGVVYGSSKAAGATDDEAKKTVDTEIVTEAVQGIYSAVTEHKLDTSPAEGDAYDKVEVLDPSDPHALPFEAYARDEAGNIIIEDGAPKVLIPKVNFRRPQAGMAGRGNAGVPWYEEGSRFMLTISSFPGMNAMAGFHDTWMSMGHPPTPWVVVSILPATVFTFEGTRAPVSDRLTEEAVDSTTQ